MKKLESLKSEKFAISENEMRQIKGGYGGSITASYTESDTCLPSGGSVCDYTHTDSCIDF
jgi:hypothetical protein